MGYNRKCFFVNRFLWFFYVGFVLVLLSMVSVWAVKGLVSLFRLGIRGRLCCFIVGQFELFNIYVLLSKELFLVRIQLRIFQGAQRGRGYLSMVESFRKSVISKSTFTQRVRMKGRRRFQFRVQRLFVESMSGVKMRSRMGFRNQVRL